MARMVTKTGKGWGAMSFIVNPAKHTALVQSHLNRATKLNALILIAKMRDEIKNGAYEPNRPLTVALKGSAKPLVGRTGQLWQSITWKEVNAQTAFVGVLRTTSVYNVAVTVHNGVVIKVTDKMRGLFYTLFKMSQGETPAGGLSRRAQELWDMMPGGWLPLQRTTKVIRIPSRPFVNVALRDSSTRNSIRNNWKQAVSTAYKQMAKQ